MSSIKAHYAKSVLRYAPRLLGQVDRRPLSPTFGCADRQFWHYKVTDFPCAMLQETALSMAGLYALDFPGNSYYRNPLLRSWVEAAVAYWARIQHRDGSFDEFYPHEHSFSATAFTLYAIMEACRLLGWRDEGVLKAARRAIDFLHSYGRPGAVNQEAAGLAGIYAYWLLSGDESVLPMGRRLADRILDAATAEGWLPEYQGADVGYGSVSLAYLTDYWRWSGDARFEPLLRQMAVFLSHFVHPDGSVGGEYGSRSTAFLLPYGFEVWSETVSEAAGVVRKLFSSANSSVNDVIDDRYLAHFILPSYLRALAHSRESQAPAHLPCEGVIQRYFDEAGIWVWGDGKRYIILNLRKGGVLKVFDKHGVVLSEPGYGAIQRGKLGVTNWIGDDYRLHVAEARFLVGGHFYHMIDRVPNTLAHAGLRLGARFLGQRLLPRLKQHLIYRKGRLPLRFRREVWLEDMVLCLRDEIVADGGVAADVYLADTFTYRYVAPSNYFRRDDLISQAGETVWKKVGRLERSVRLDLRTLDTQRESLVNRDVHETVYHS